MLDKSEGIGKPFSTRLGGLEFRVLNMAQIHRYSAAVRIQKVVREAIARMQLQRP